jgi:hypothetical protein
MDVKIDSKQYLAHIFEFCGEILIVFLRNKKEIVATIPLQDFHFMESLWFEGSNESVDLKVALMRALNDDGEGFFYRFNEAEAEILDMRNEALDGDIGDNFPAERNWEGTLSHILEEARSHWRCACNGDGTCP